MNSKRKGIALVAAILIMFSLSGCSKKASEKSSKEPTIKSSGAEKSSSKNANNSEEASKKTEENSKESSEPHNEQSDINLISYHNNKFDFSIDYPDIFSEKKEGDNGDGISLKSSDGEYSLIIYGAYNVNNYTGAILLEEAKERVSHISDEFVNDIFYSVDYSDDGGKDGKEHIFHECGFIVDEKVIGYIISYPLEEKDQFNQIITDMTDDLVKDYDYNKVNIEEYDFFPLIEALCLSEVQHYDSFTAEPDGTTIAFTLCELLGRDCFPWKDTMNPDDTGAYYFSQGPESEGSASDDKVYISPDELYQQYFANGKYKYPPEKFNYISEGTQTGIAIYMSGRPYDAYVEIFDIGGDEYKIELAVSIYRGIEDGSLNELLGNAIITLKKDDSGYFGYKILSFQPKYNKFEDI